MIQDLSKEEVVVLGQGIDTHLKQQHIPFCYLNEEARGEAPSEQSVLLPRFFETKNTEEITEYLKLVYDRVITTLTDKIYSGFSKNILSNQYIETVIGSFIQPLIWTAYAKYLYIKQLACLDKTKLAGAKFPVGVKPFMSGGVLVCHIQNNPYLSTIISTKIAMFLGMPIETCIPLTFEKSAQLSPDFIYFRDGPKYHQNDICIFLLSTGRIGNWKLNQSKQYNVICFDTLIQDDLELKYEIKEEQRERLNLIQGADEFETLIYALLSDLMPYQSLENFIFNQSLASDYINRTGVPKAILTGQGLTFNYLFAFWVAECRTRNVPFYIAQHGGVYGECRQSATEYIERKIADSFLSWGWKGEKVIPLDSMKRISLLSKFISRTQVKKYDVLIISTYEPLMINTYVGMYGYKLFDYHLHQERVVKALLQCGFKHIYLRPYKGQKKWASKLLSLSDSVKLVDLNENILLQMSYSKLVIFDYLGASSFIDALKLNVPSMVVYDNKITQIRTSAEANYKLMEEAKVVMKMGDFCQNILDVKHGGISKWWRTEENMHLRADFMKYQYGVGARYMKKWRIFCETIV